MQLDGWRLVVRRGDPADALFGIVDGAVRVIVPGLGPDAQPRLCAGDIFGEASLLGSEPRRADVRAEGALTALRIPKHTLTQLVRLHPGLGDVLFEMLAAPACESAAHLARVRGARAGRTARSGRRIRAAARARRHGLLVPGKRADALYITLTGQVEVRVPGAAARVEDAGMMFGHASVLEGGACEAGVRTLIPFWCCGCRGRRSPGSQCSTRAS